MLTAKHVRRRGVEVSLGHVSTGPRLDFLAVERRGPAVHAQPALFENRLVDDPKHRHAVVEQRDQRAEQRLACGTSMQPLES